MRCHVASLVELLDCLRVKQFMYGTRARPPTSGHYEWSIHISSCVGRIQVTRWQQLPGYIFNI